MSIEAMKQALEALEDVQEMMNTSQWFNDRVTALRQAIEQAEKQEPVAYIEHHKGGDNLRWEEVNHYYAKATPLYTAPPQEDWVGLTMEDVNELYENYDPSQWYDFLRDVEAKLKEKNHG